MFACRLSKRIHEHAGPAHTQNPKYLDVPPFAWITSRPKWHFSETACVDNTR
jgi:hypothetical protein